MITHELLPSQQSTYRCGTVAIVGRPNVGKSTLLNHLLGFKLSIVSHKPQTTRHRILGILTRSQAQLIFLDTPGLHRPGKQAMSRHLNRIVRQVLDEADVLIHVIEAGFWRDEDQQVEEAIITTKRPCLLGMNKVDLVKDKKVLLSFIEKINSTHQYAEIYPLSARRNQGLSALEQGITQRLPSAPPTYGDDDITDRSERFLAAELVREQLMRQLNQELPYATTVEIEQFIDDDSGLKRISAVIWVEREGQKAIVIGTSGERLKRIGTTARIAMEKLLQSRVFLNLWVRVRKNWSDNETALKHLGYSD